MAKKHNKLWLVLGLVILIILAGIIYAVALRNEIGEKPDFDEVSVYYVNAATNVLEAERHNIPKTKDNVEKVETVFKEYINGPKSSNLTTASTKIDIRDIVSVIYPYENKTSVVGINLSAQYDELTPSRQLFLISSLAYTFTELDFIEDVDVLCAGKPLVSQATGMPLTGLSKEVLLNNPSFVPEKINRKNIILYFSNGLRLVQEERSIQVKQSQSLEYQIVEQLILGPYSTNLKSVIPAETKIRDIKTEDGICYVNLSAEFVSKASVDDNEKLMSTYSIVNSLTELDNVNKVQFLIEGEKITEFYGRSDFSKTYERNADLIIH